MKKKYINTNRPAIFNPTGSNSPRMGLLRFRCLRRGGGQDSYASRAASILINTPILALPRLRLRFEPDRRLRGRRPQRRLSSLSSRRHINTCGVGVRRGLRLGVGHRPSLCGLPVNIRTLVNRHSIRLRLQFQTVFPFGAAIFRLLDKRFRGRFSVFRRMGNSGRGD